ncbi:MAG: hypothetical protein WC756_03760 [Taibaiella sp.]|jgi:prophage tail gpP-like protein
MILKIGTRKIDLYNQVSVTLNYDSVASTFAFSLFFDPNNEEHKRIFKPLQYLPATIEHNGQTLITGTMLSGGFSDGSEKSLVTVSGYSKTGVLEDCEIPMEAYPLQTDSLSLKQICERLIKPFDLTLIIDPSVLEKVNGRFTRSTAGDDQTVKAYIDELARQKYVVLTHDQYGNLLLTEAKPKQTPIWNFDSREKFVKMDLNTDGQQMHNTITYQKQATKRGKGNAGQSSVDNPYCKVYRPKVSRQTSGESIDTKFVSRNGLSEELKAIELTIELDSWNLGGKLILPNNIVTVTNPVVFLYKKTEWFIKSVEFSGDENSSNINDGTAKLVCCLPEVFTKDMPVNIFD